MPNPDGKSITRFGLFEADLKSGELRRNGQKVRLQEQPFQLLALLLEKRGQLVSREELRERLWPSDTFVDFDHGVNAAIKRLRDALGDSAENPRFVETLARRGYRFIAPVESLPEGPATEAANSSRPWLVPSVLATLVLVGVLGGWHAGRRSVAAVRPVERNLTGNRQNDPVWGAALSPDGKYLAFSYKAGLFLRVLPTGETHALPEADNRKTYRVNWFPDSTRLLTMRSAGPGQKPELWSDSVLGGAPRKLVDDGDQGTVSPDGTKIAFVRGEFNHQEIWVVDADGQHPEKLVSAEGAFGSVTWAPDGRHIGFVHHVDRLDSEGNISVEICESASRPTGKPFVVFRNSRLWNALAWTRDNRLIYSVGEPPPNRTDSNLWAQTIDPARFQPVGAPVRLTSGPDGKARLTLSADGKQLSYLRLTHSPHVYVAEIKGAQPHVGPLRRLSLDEGENYPYDWTPDGQTLIFKSDRDGPFHLFKQTLNQRAPELLVGGDDNVVIARIDPKGSAILYLLSTPASDFVSPGMCIKRIPVNGGVPELVLADSAINNFQCARRTSTVCVLSIYAPNHLSLYTFDAVNGQKTLLKTIYDPEWSLFNWSLSPDGTTLALSKKQRPSVASEISLLGLDGSENKIPLDGWFATDYVDWAADGKSLWVNATTQNGTATLLKVTRNGKITPVLEENEMVLGWAIPSPDGRHIAIWKGEQGSNAWLLAGF